ncbi:LytTR family DNA-binding domain-containing protein [Terrimonas sp. NA20]|uniref:LytTR family DNA-binding domain-containing protein n=1 Tax=Terrimonas ginsenosidimutans TaxID=2908004 RepID=A0ABS9KUE4_9BACT|nr:LytTR family DNA-binding domain-containing protein [Terrimonas ginsenosidimutans]MCG2615950.1 LytTR family DNA-binding domain-containing protein [Terrimonas ginsenosidimutans]
MHKYKALIVDDEHSGRAVLSRLLQLYTPELELIGTAGTIESARDLISTEHPDIVFLDIRMNQESGFDLLEDEMHRSFALIFVTGHDEYAIPAIRAEAVDYLLKPVDVLELKQAVERAKKKLHTVPASVRETGESVFTEGSLTVHLHSQVLIVHPEDVVYAEANRRYCKVVLADGRCFTVPKSLSELQELWPARRKFCRISRGILLNVKYVESYSKTWPCLIHVAGGMTFQVSRRKKAEVLAVLGE